MVECCNRVLTLELHILKLHQEYQSSWTSFMREIARSHGSYFRCSCDILCRESTVFSGVQLFSCYLFVLTVLGFPQGRTVQQHVVVEGFVTMQGGTSHRSVSQHNLGDARFSLYGIEIGDAQEGERQRDDHLLHNLLG